MSEPTSELDKRRNAERPHRRLLAAIVAVFTTVVAVTGLFRDAIKLPNSVWELWHWMWPGPEEPPVSLTIAAVTTKPAPGYSIVNVAGIGEVFGGGADIRLVAQAQSMERIATVVRLSAKVKRMSVPTQVAFHVDPLAQPGFGAARPKTFLVTLEDETRGTVTYVINQQSSVEAPFPELLPSDLVLPLGGTDGVQDTIDVKLRLKSPGIYEVSFVATVVSNKKEYVVETPPLRMGRK